MHEAKEPKKRRRRLLLPPLHYHYSDLLRMTKRTIRTINGEHHEAVHHMMKDFERKPVGVGPVDNRPSTD